MVDHSEQSAPRIRTPLARRLYPLPDTVLFLYLLCIVRQYLWPVGNGSVKNAIAWSISTLVAGVIIWLLSGQRGDGWEGSASTVESGWHSWISTKEQGTRGLFAGIRVEWLWLIVVVAPILIFFFLRAPFPAFEMDHLNYHLVNTERALRGWPMINGDFFPGTLLVNPAPDMVFGVLKYLIGYRLAPLLNVAVLLWTANLLNEILAPILAKRIVRYFAILFIVATDQISYLINIYMIDLLSLPLLTAAALLTIRLSQSRHPDRSLIKIALLLGISVAFKLTNAFFAIPIALLCVYELIKLYREHRLLPKKTTIAIAVLAGALPSVFFLAYMFSQTGNPFFPYYNGIFKSSLMVPANYHDQEIGPHGLLAKFFWPISSFVYPTNLSAMNTAIIYSGRLNFGFILALCVLLWRQAPSSIRKICFVMVLGCYLWSFGSGDLRYALVGEIFGGVACCFIFKYLYDQVSTKLPTARMALLKTRIAFVLVLGFATFQSLFGLWFGLVHFECANESLLCDRVMQPIFTNRFTGATFKSLADLDMPRQLDFNKNYSYRAEASYLLRDRVAQDFYSPSDKAQFRDVEMWINCIDATSGYMAMAADSVPMVSVAKFLHLFNYMQADGARLRVREILRTNRSKKMFTIVQKQRYEEALPNLARAGLTPGRVQEISLPMYSPNIRAHLLLVELIYNDAE